MAERSEESALGRGYYTVAEASRLLGMSPSTIWRYIRGYAYKKGERLSPPAFSADFVEAMEVGVKVQGVSFYDLMELKMVAAFFSLGVRGEEIRRAQIVAVRRFGHSHPFCSSHFKTDGRSVILETAQETGSRRLEEIARGQALMEAVIEPYLMEVKFSGVFPGSWLHPKGKEEVVLHPRRAFGQPVLRVGGIPTRILAASAASWGDVDAVAVWYDVPKVRVVIAMEFEKAIHQKAA